MIPDEAPSKMPTLSHRAEYGIYRLFEGILCLFPLELVCLVGHGLGLLAWALSAKHRRLVTRNLRIATARDRLTPQQLRKLVRQTFQLAGGNLLSSIKVANMPPEEVAATIDIEGFDSIKKPTEQGQGVALVWSHMGNWEMMAQLISSIGKGIRGGPIYRPLENPLLDALTLKRRTQQGAVVFNKHDGFNGPARLLREGGVVTIMTDQRAGGHGELCPFFGRLSSCTPLPSLIARRAKAAMVSLSITSLDPGRWKLRIRPIPQGASTSEVIHHLEIAMRDQLADVFWFHDRWRIDRTRPLSFYTKESPTNPAQYATNPTRIVATLPPHDSQAVETLTRILEIRPDAHIDVLDPGNLPPLPNDPRITTFPWERDAPPEHLAGVLNRCDESQTAPLDFALWLDGSPALASAASAHGLRAIIGVGPGGKPWTRTFPKPTDQTGWRELAEALAATPSSGTA